jgi:predicted DNA-binding transcriptional regulator YafY
MAAGLNQRLKLLILADMFQRETDETHGLTVPEIIERLERADVTVERKTLYRDLEELKNFGYDIISQQDGRQVRYHLVSRTFELPELKLLVDAVQSSKFITERKSRELIEKLEGLVSRHDARYLHRQVLLTGRVKTANERIYYNVDRLHEAIGDNVQVRFHYFRWTREGKMTLRRDGAWYQVSPWALLWDDENYYLAAVDRQDGVLKNYRVDRMAKLRVRQERREKKELSRSFDPALYSKRMFGMYGGEVVTVLLRCEERMANVIIDRFGTEPPFLCRKEGYFDVPVSVAVSPLFLSWIINFGGAIEILSPAWVREELCALAGAASSAHTGAAEE